MTEICNNLCPKCGKGLTYFENRGDDARYKCYSCGFTMLKSNINIIKSKPQTDNSNTNKQERLHK